MAYGDDWSDPGWPPRLFLALLPLGGRLFLGVRRRSFKGIVAMRAVYLAFLATPFHLLVVVAFLARGSASEEAMSSVTAAAITGVLGAGSVAMSLWSGKRVPLDEASVVGAYRAVFFLRFALAQAAVLIGFVMFFFAGGGRLWIYVEGLVLGMIGLIAMAPTKRAIDAWDKERRGASPRPSLGALLSAE